MKIIDVFGMCFRNLYKRKLRTFLTLLGVMIGTGSIILMISLGNATDAQFAQMIEEMALDMTAIRVQQRWGGMMWNPDGTMTQQEQGEEMTDETADRFARIPGVVLSTPLMRGQILLRTGPYAMFAWDVRGIRPDALALMGYNVEYGRLLEPGDEFAAVFGSKVEREFFTTIMTGNSFGFWSDRYWREVSGEEVETLVDVLNDPIRIYPDTNSLWRGIRWGDDDDDGGVAIDDAFEPVRSFPFEVVGLLEHYEITRWDDQRSNTVIYMNIDTLQTLNQMNHMENLRAQEDDEWWPRITMSKAGPRESYDLIFVRVESMDDTSRVATAIDAMGFNAHYEAERIEQSRDALRSIETLLSLIAAVSLVVAAINISNTMITSVTERTREIGVMKVIGASLSDIRKLFLTEAATIGLLGGVFGVVLALGCSYVVNNFDIPFLAGITLGVEGAPVSLITPQLCLIALVVACVVGIASGFFPALRATRLSALAAIRGD